jgi:dipeptidyl aminopeptidase/acylaminoacyl peptidase
MGGSYGGYATLAGLTFTPEVFACGVDIVGPSNLETLLQTIPPYWTAVIEQFHQRMGNPNTEEGLALLKERSPLYKAGNIVKPLLIGQGANDPRVKQAESDQIVSAMNEKGIPVTYVLFPDEGHGFARPENNIAFNAVTENFLATCLGGRAEPIGNTVKVSSAKVPTGAAFTQGLEAALQ